MAKLFKFTDFSKGQSLKSNQFASADGRSKNYGTRSAQSVLNVNVDETGMEMMPGALNQLTTALGAKVYGLEEYIKSSLVTTRSTLFVSGSKVYKKTGSSVTELYTGLTPNRPVKIVTFNQLALIMNGVDPVLQYDGSTCTTVTFTDPGTIWNNFRPSWAAVTARNRILYTGDPNRPDQILTPRPNTHNNFDNTGSQVDGFNVAIGDGGNVVAVKVLTDGRIIIFKSNAIYQLTGSQPSNSLTDPFAVKEISTELGCLNPRTIVQVGLDLYFLSQSGYKSLTQVAELGTLQDGDPYYECQPILDSINPNAIAECFAVYIPTRKQIYLHLPTGSSLVNDTVLVYNTITGGIMQRDGLNASSGALINGDYLTGTYNGQITKQFTGGDYNGTAIKAHWESKWLDFGNLNSKKRFTDLLIYLKKGSNAKLVVKYKLMKSNGAERTKNLINNPTNSNDTWDVGNWDEAIWDAAEDSVFKKHRLGRGNAIKIRIENLSGAISEPFELDRIELNIEDKGIVGL